ncbi:hypothetical protein PLESTM_001355100 [Pleodorina starrii]|nr:hypothetical protein PLESTM_001355100 [Pleodorina starrii]
MHFDALSDGCVGGVPRLLLLPLSLLLLVLLLLLPVGLERRTASRRHGRCPGEGMYAVVGSSAAASWLPQVPESALTHSLHSLRCVRARKRGGGGEGARPPPASSEATPRVGP